MQFAGALAFVAGVWTIAYSILTRSFAAGGWALIALATGAGVVYAAGRSAHRAETILRARLELLRFAIQRFTSEKGRGPASLHDLVAGGYLTEVPIDPVRWPSRCWDEVRDAGAIVDVHSKSRSPALDDTAYCTW